MCGALASATDPRAYTSDFTLCHEDPTGQIHPLFAYRAWLTKSSHRATARGSRDCPLASPRALGYKYRSLYAPVYHRSCTESISPTSGRHGERVRTMPSARRVPWGIIVPPPPPPLGLPWKTAKSRGTGGGSDVLWGPRCSTELLAGDVPLPHSALCRALLHLRNG
jgi:hypothetical protein